MQRLFLLASALLAPQAYGNGFDWAPKVSESDADASLAVELSGIDDARIADYEAAMRTTVATLPRNEFGRLSHEAVHYVLHRLFVARFGWFFKGLEPNEDESDDSARAKDMILRLQKRLEEPSGNKGFSLHELAVLAAALEDLVHQEASIQLRAAWKASGFETNQSITREEAENVVASYMMIFLAARDISAAKRTDLIEALRKFKKGYTDWEAAEKWLVDLEIKTWGPKTEAPGSFDFSATEKMVQNIGKEFGHFNDMECKALKTTLHELEHRSPKAGRVRLPDFYNKSFYSHWRFNEKVDYLKDMGALDDTNKEQPLVISANYAMARSNCLEATDFFAVCCRNECEDLMALWRRASAWNELPRTASNELFERSALTPYRHRASFPSLSGIASRMSPPRRTASSICMVVFLRSGCTMRSRTSAHIPTKRPPIPRQLTSGLPRVASLRPLRR